MLFILISVQTTNVQVTPTKSTNLMKCCSFNTVVGKSKICQTNKFINVFADFDYIIVKVYVIIYFINCISHMVFDHKFPLHVCV